VTASHLHPRLLQRAAGHSRRLLPYYTKAELTDVTDPQLIYDLQKKLDAEGIYHWEEVAAFAMAFFDPKAAAASSATTARRPRSALPSATPPESRQHALDFKRTANVTATAQA
jgi:type I restriction enzyme R subunit